MQNDIVVNALSWGLGLGIIVYFFGYGLSQVIHFFKALTK